MGHRFAQVIGWTRLTERQQYRLLEILPGVFVWASLILAIIFSFVAPLWAIVFILLFDVYWLIRVLYVMVYILLGFRKYRKTSGVDWHEKLQTLPDWQKIHHLIFLPTFREPFDVIEGTLTSLARVAYPNTNLIVVLATEGREAERIRPIANQLQNQYRHTFQAFLVTEHPGNIPGEVAGKGANAAWAAKEARQYIDAQHIPYENVIVSTFDVDTIAHPQYFSYLTYTFLTHPNPQRSSYQPIPLFHNNVWESLFLMRVVASSTTFWLLSEALRSDRLFTFSSHSMPFKALVEVGYWQTDVVNEDSRIFVQSFLHYDGEYSVTPLYLPISMDTVQAHGWRESIRNQYKQIQRWAYGGVENFPFSVWNFLHNPKLSRHTKLKYTWIQMEGIYSWATAPLLIFILGWLPFTVANASMPSSTLVQNGPSMIQTLMGLAMIGLFASSVLSTVMLPKRPVGVPWYRWIMMIGQWFFLPVTMIVFGSLPAIDAQTRMMLGKYMGFVVTSKTRSRNPIPARST